MNITIKGQSYYLDFEQLNKFALLKDHQAETFEFNDCLFSIQDLINIIEDPYYFVLTNEILYLCEYFLLDDEELLSTIANKISSRDDIKFCLDRTAYLRNKIIPRIHNPEAYREYIDLMSQYQLFLMMMQNKKLFTVVHSYLYYKIYRFNHPQKCYYLCVLLLNEGYDIKENYFENEIIFACKSGDLRIIKYYFEKNDVSPLIEDILRSPSINMLQIMLSDNNFPALYYIINKSNELNQTNRIRRTLNELFNEYYDAYIYHPKEVITLIELIEGITRQKLNTEIFLLYSMLVFDVDTVRKLASREPDKTTYLNNVLHRLRPKTLFSNFYWVSLNKKYSLGFFGYRCINYLIYFNTKTLKFFVKLIERISSLIGQKKTLVLFEILLSWCILTPTLLIRYMRHGDYSYYILGLKLITSKSLLALPFHSLLACTTSITTGELIGKGYLYLAKLLRR
jgi:hypothetical protein